MAKRTYFAIAHKLGFVQKGVSGYYPWPYPAAKK